MMFRILFSIIFFAIFWKFYNFWNVQVSFYVWSIPIIGSVTYLLTLMAVCLFNGLSKFPYKAGKLHFHAFVGALLHLG